MGSALPEIDWDALNPQIDEIIAEYKGQPKALIETMHKVQELVGFLPRHVQIKIAEGLGVAQTEVFSVASFYSHFSFKPKGKYQTCICMGTACYVKGAPQILEKIEKHLGIEAGDTTDDGLFSLESVRCLGACGLGPVMTINNEAHGLLKPDKAIQILHNCACKEKEEAKKAEEIKETKEVKNQIQEIKVAEETKQLPMAGQAEQIAGAETEEASQPEELEELYPEEKKEDE